MLSYIPSVIYSPPFRFQLKINASTVDIIVVIEAATDILEANAI